MANANDWPERRKEQFNGLPEAICLFLEAQKYVLFSFIWNGNEKLIVRTGLPGNYHAGIIAETKKEISSNSFQPHSNMGYVDSFPGFELKCLGGGWIKLAKRDNGVEIVLHGSSHDYGRADHQKAADVLREEINAQEFPFEVVVVAKAGK